MKTINPKTLPHHEDVAREKQRIEKLLPEQGRIQSFVAHGKHGTNAKFDPALGTKSN